MVSNLDLWNRVCKTDPRHVKPITGKQYSGNSPKPYYIVQRLTEEFGPCGTGWGFDIINERMERMSDTDILHIAQIEFWYGTEGAKFQQMGQTKAAYMTSRGTLLVDEDAPKKSVTDALVKCASYLGFAGDIFMGMWDDSKYVAALKKEFAEEETALERDLRASVEGIEQAKQRKGGVMGAVLRDLNLTPPVITRLTALGKAVEATHEEYKSSDECFGLMFDQIEIEELNNDEKTFLWALLPSNIRSALKKEGEARKEHA